MNEIEGVQRGRVLVLGSVREGGKSMVLALLNEIAGQQALRVDKLYADIQCVEEGPSKAVNAPHGPQPKGKKGKVRKW